MSFMPDAAIAHRQRSHCQAAAAEPYGARHTHAMSPGRPPTPSEEIDILHADYFAVISAFILSRCVFHCHSRSLAFALLLRRRLIPDELLPRHCRTMPSSTPSARYFDAMIDDVSLCLPTLFPRYYERIFSSFISGFAITPRRFEITIATPYCIEATRRCIACDEYFIARVSVAMPFAGCRLRPRFAPIIAAAERVSFAFFRQPPYAISCHYYAIFFHVVAHTTYAIRATLRRRCLFTPPLFHFRVFLHAFSRHFT